ncbi:MAG: phosphotransferase [Oscillospiraceae bacterium]|nr:phosphotransferase [Oscillospiraceae bacterium]
MNNTNYNLNFNLLCETLHLGALTGTPSPLAGGHLHRMFALQTQRGKYAVKALNPQVMQRSPAKADIENGERIARIAAAHGIAAPHAKELTQIQGQYYLVFDWVNGAPRYHDAINETHCQTMGKLLAKLHDIDFSAVALQADEPADELIDWQPYADILRDDLHDIYRWNEQLLAAQQRLPCHHVISHRDLEPKNVMWQDDRPIVIDWEAAGLVHPLCDLVETALAWARDEHHALSPTKFKAFVGTYHQHAPLTCDNWQAVLTISFGNHLGWLAYNCRRALGVECADQAEQTLGAQQVAETIALLRRVEIDMANILQWLTEIVQ